MNPLTGFIALIERHVLQPLWQQLLAVLAVIALLVSFLGFGASTAAPGSPPRHHPVAQGLHESSTSCPAGRSDRLASSASTCNSGRVATAPHPGTSSLAGEN